MKRIHKDAMPSAALKAQVRVHRQRRPLDADDAALLFNRPARRAARPLPRLGPRVVRLVRPMLRGSGASLAELSVRWKELAGPRLAKVCRPDRLLRSRDGTVLEVIARGGAGAAFVELERDALVQRINAAFGRGFVSRLRIRQGRIGVPDAPAPLRPAKPSAQAVAALERKLERLPPGRLRESVRHLGLALLARKARV